MLTKAKKAEQPSDVGAEYCPRAERCLREMAASFPAMISSAGNGSSEPKYFLPVICWSFLSGSARSRNPRRVESLLQPHLQVCVEREKLPISITSHVECNLPLSKNLSVAASRSYIQSTGPLNSYFVFTELFFSKNS